MIEEKPFSAPTWPEGSNLPKSCPLRPWNRVIQAAVVFGDPDIITGLLIWAIRAVLVSVTHEVVLQAATWQRRGCGCSQSLPDPALSLMTHIDRRQVHCTSECPFSSLQPISSFFHPPCLCPPYSLTVSHPQPPSSGPDPGSLRKSSLYLTAPPLFLKWQPGPVIPMVCILQ